MVALDEDALVCDLAETYGVTDYRALPLQTAATLGIGLSWDSRIRQKQTGIIVPLSTFLLAQAIDGINMLCWLNSVDGEKNRNRPVSISEKMKVEEETNEGQFADAADFEEARLRLLTSPKEGE